MSIACGTGSLLCVLAFAATSYGRRTAVVPAPPAVLSPLPPAASRRPAPATRGAVHSLLDGAKFVENSSGGARVPAERTVVMAPGHVPVDAEARLLEILGASALPGASVVASRAASSRIAQGDDAQNASERSQPALGLMHAAILAGTLGLGTATSVSALNVDGLTPENFRPVCPASDGLYGFGKSAADGLLGAEGMEYRPLAIEALLRVRLEICVLESFVYEAVVPFVQRKGLGWILPLHETLDTVIAGTVFAIALNFILFGTTKILSVISIYHDFLLGAPLRLIGYTILPEKPQVKDPPLIQINWPGTAPPPPPPVEDEEDDEEEKPPPPLPLQVFGTACKAYGTFADITKTVFEGLDTFTGRYLAIASIAYIAFKWAHFRVFPDFPPF